MGQEVQKYKHFGDVISEWFQVGHGGGNGQWELGKLNSEKGNQRRGGEAVGLKARALVLAHPSIMPQ